MRYKIETIRVRLEVRESLGEVGFPGIAEEILRAIYKDLDEDQEHFSILCLDMKNNVTGYKVISSGSMGSCPADPKIIFRNALLMGGRAIILCHNHPSNDPYPSSEDLKITRQLAEGGKILDIKVFDHIILAESSYYSFLEHGSMG